MRIEKVSSRQVIFFIIISRVTTVISFMPTINMPPANQDIWLMVIISIFYSIILLSPIVFLTNRFCKFSIIEYMGIIFGKGLGKILGLSYGLYFLYETVYMVNVQVQVITTTLLTEASNFIITSIIIVVCVYIASKGLEVYGRTSELLGPIIIFVIFIVLISGYRNVELALLLPIYKDSTLLELSQGAIEMTLLFREVVVLTMICPNLEDSTKLNSIFLKSVFFSTIIIIFPIVFSQGALGVEQAKHANFPFLTYTRLITAHGVAERIESFYVAVWIFAKFIKVTGFLYISSRSLREIFGRGEEKTLVIITGIAIGIIALYVSLKSPILGLGSFLGDLSTTLSAIFLVILPLVTLIVYFFRRKTIEKEEKLQSW
ncbi:Spore germination protein KB [Proteiniborus sp. DW1]|uniref:GerAB/ArcD/ProY family transporter n=1 Tax=Proteiniborus sp. DW1 TaxID=1889883 RepID=UPI00092E0E0A|nr:endospore germination permease [Proteiniborus sp. DW1]SCG82955.1 Spore germination protein KB [Proteiniborus sp. DW1]